ncbi:MAG: hypoxanthine phosphoribosyltransferase [Myxococcales bacterium]|nr:hypoxanthine phosphoribosyltransferase [Myxococcales bacterium]MCB9708921.1 hypoxanthine phosphoribosyltransferase [Myxococcales bacterium]
MRPPQVLFDSETIAARVQQLGAQIQKDYADKKLVLVPVLKGSLMFAADLARAIDLPLSIDFLGLRSYGNRTETSGIVQITADLTHPIEEMDVIVVEDIVDTGLTMDYLMENLGTRKPRSMKLAALLHKPSRTRSMVNIDYLGFTIEDVFVVGYGLDHAELYRNLPYIGVLESND